jgi:hypothetical protein
MPPRVHYALLSAIVLSLAVAVACNATAPTAPSGSTVTNFLSGAATSGGTPVQGSQQSGTPPAPGSGPTATIGGNATAVAGGSSVVTVSGSAPFQSVVVSAGSPSGTGSASLFMPGGLGGARTAATSSPTGFFRIDLPSPVTTQPIIVTFVPSIPATTFNLQIQLISATGAVGAVATLPVTVHAVTTSAVEVNVSWNQPSDVDLHVVEPDGNEIFFGNKGPSPSGGVLDLDSNDAPPGVVGVCIIDNIDNENVSWPTGTPEAGTYQVKVDYFSTCGVSAVTSFVVTVTNNGVVSTFTGQFTPDDQDFNQSGGGRLMTTFVHVITAASPAAHAWAFVSAPPAVALQTLQTALRR